MNCWIFNQYINTPETPGGSRHYELGRALAGRGHEIVLFGARPEKNRSIFYFEKKDGVSILWFNIDKYYGKSVKRFMNMLCYAFLVLCVPWAAKKNKRHIHRPDIIIGSSVHLFGAYAAYLVSCYMKVPFVFEVRDLWPQTLIDMGALSSTHPLAKIMRILEKQLYEKSVFIISLLPYASDYICSNYDVPTEKIKWLPNGVNIDAFPLQEWPEGKDFNIVYVGAHGIANVLDTIVAVAERLQSEGINDIKLKLIGTGPLKPALIERAEEKRIQNIEFHDPIPKKDLYKSASHAHAFIVNLKDIPLYKYGISLNKIYDYLAMKRPIIIGCSARNNPVEEAQAGISVAGDNADELYHAILELHNMSRTDLEIMGMKGRNYVEANNDYKKLGNRLEQWLAAQVNS